MRSRCSRQFGAARRLGPSLLVLSLALLSSPATADSPGKQPPAVTAVPPSDASVKTPWSDAVPHLLADLEAGLPLVTVVFVPLCSNSQIRCGGQGAGDPSSLDRNLYWGRAFGVRRYFNETARGWKEVARANGGGAMLEELVYASAIPGAHFGVKRESIEQLLVLRAVQGDAIELAVDGFYELAVRGGRASFGEGSARRDVRVHVAGYAGHNRLMDGYALKPVTAAASESPIPSFVIACKSEPYFSAALRERGSTPLVMTRDYVAPEGYAIEALVNALGENLPARDVRARVVRAYARWQRLSERTASTIFAR
jgi:hypothetical protein